MKFWLAPHTGVDEPLFSLPVAARLARISMDLLEQTVSEGLVHPQPIAGGEEGLTYGEVRRLLHVRSLVEDLGLEVSAVDVVLRMRERMLLLLEEMQELEMQSARREEKLLGEIRRLQRRVAREPDWR
jgi:hypothetical protein